jgi:hypothetical protein
MLVSTARKAERSLPIRPRFGEATLCGNAEFPSWRRNDQVNVIDGTSTLSRGVCRLDYHRAVRRGVAATKGGFHDSAFTP